VSKPSRKHAMKEPPKNVFEAIRGTQKDIGNSGGARQVVEGHSQWWACYGGC